uniref:Uncharacterized protein n=1 Tax=Onchocerca volvulus TaxID=6282 RepID=A0A8R1Y0G5_ONCVO
MNLKIPPIDFRLFRYLYKFTFRILLLSRNDLVVLEISTAGIPVVCRVLEDKIGVFIDFQNLQY